MKILLSAYACEPNKGSEPEVGWNWATRLASSGHDIYVLTRTNNKETIRLEINRKPIKNLHFIYYDLPDWIKRWKKGKLGIYLYYFLWQIGIFFVARNLMRKVSFDLIHHVTFVSIRQPSFLGLLGLPFIFGPVAGGEQTPVNLRKNYPIRGRTIDLLRDILNQWIRISPLMRLTFRTAKVIFVTSNQTKEVIPKTFHEKTFISLAIGSESTQKIGYKKQNTPKNFQILYAGQLLYWKGIHLALKTFALLNDDKESFYKVCHDFYQ